ncbi:TadE/TadG family type IV pilus assembly protein [Phenylobacterium sp.]|uniref:TadE/TadG family type IV pilus assembly protein n=1 Tax=Phenylobacterium sp. TaxID=1871053 RepID=UPI002E376442|nr:TadE/TadG family type IV pilus assembly protein [Phenylobacterium sp.]HEX4709449.1 TadE/TadG family type IV pilus assembly protein [Phenylobacterium sp.]
MSGRARRWADDSGATALEFALVVPVFIALLIGAFQVSWVMHAAATVRWSLESSARTLLLDPTTTEDQLRALVSAKLAGLVNTSDVTVTLVSDTTTAGAPVLRASSDYRPTLSIPLVGHWNLDLRATTVVPTP